MAHSPERPNRYVCTDCQVLHAGTVVERRESGHVYEAPEECGCCGATAFVAETRWASRQD